MKKFFSIFLAVLLLTLSFSGCQGKKTVKVNGISIDSEVYSYFEDESVRTSVPVEDLVLHYVTVNSKASSKNIVIPRDERDTLSKKVNNIWSFYSKYYEDLGVSKQTIYKIESSKTLYDCLLVNYYGENGEKPIPEEEIKAYFDENYISVRYVTDYLFNIDENGKVIPLNDIEKNALLEKFTSVASIINEGTIIEEAVGNLSSNTEIRNVLVNSFSDDTLPEGFFKSASAIEKGKAGVITLGDYIFLCKRENPFEGEYSHYNEYRNKSLIKMKSDEFATVFKEWEKEYSNN